MWFATLIAGAALALTGFFLGTYAGAFMLTIGLAGCFLAGALAGGRG